MRWRSAVERAREMQRLQAIALTNIHKAPVATQPKDLSSALIESLRGSVEPHNIDAWLMRALSSLYSRCPRLKGVITMPDEAWDLCKDQETLKEASSWAAGMLLAMVDQKEAAGKAFIAEHRLEPWLDSPDSRPDSRLTVA